MRTCRQTRRKSQERRKHFGYFGQARKPLPKIYKQIPADGKVRFEKARNFLRHDTMPKIYSEQELQLSGCGTLFVLPYFPVIPLKHPFSTLVTVVCCNPHSPSTESVCQKKFICLGCRVEKPKQIRNRLPSSI